MGKIFSRQEIIDRLNATVKQGRPIIASGASAGIVAKCAELAEADLIVVYSTGLSRILGLPTRSLQSASHITLNMLDEIGQVVSNTPIIGGFDANDPFYMDHEKLLKKFMDAGISGTIHCPNIWMQSEGYRNLRDSVGLGFAREMALTALARKKGLFNMAYCFTPKDTIDMVRAGADCVVAHAGATRGGLCGFVGKGFDEAVAQVNRVIDAAKSVNPDIICLAHGGPFANPEDTRVIYERTSAVGFVGASSVERIPIEEGVTAAVREFKKVPLKKVGRS